MSPAVRRGKVGRGSVGILAICLSDFANRRANPSFEIYSNNSRMEIIRGLMTRDFTTLLQPGGKIQRKCVAQRKELFC